MPCSRAIPTTCLLPSLCLCPRLHCLLPWPTGRESPFKIQFKYPKAFSHQTSSPFHPNSAHPKVPSLCPTAPCTLLQYGTPMAEQVVAFLPFHKIVSSYIFMSHSFEKYLLGPWDISVNETVGTSQDEQLPISQDPN